MLTHNNKEADEDGRERAHAELERAAFLNEFAVFAPKPFGTVAAVARLTVHARAAIAARKVETFVLVYTSLAVR